MQSKWCKTCNKAYFEDNVCPECGGILQADIPTEILWCSNCKVPIIHEQNDKNNKCLICGAEAKYLCKDLRPVFPEERLLIEILHGKPFEWMGKSVWANGSRYYVNGKVNNVSLGKYREADIASAVEQLAANTGKNKYTSFYEYITLFLQVNNSRLKTIADDARQFVITESIKYLPDQRIISFSGGKDSTVTADIVIKALRDPSVRHIFGDTTLELPQTYEYCERYCKANPKAVFKTAKNKEQDFYKVCEDIGPPARMMCWCCTMFKTGPITRALNSAFREERVLTFYGIRKSESIARSKYNRIEDTFRYRSYYYDTETGFYYLQTRYYDPEIRRFINKDSISLLPELAQIIGQLNLYAYCGNNPVMYTDPTGEAWWDWVLSGVIVAGLIIGAVLTGGMICAAFLGASIGGGISVVSQAVGSLINGTSFSWGQFALDVGVGALSGAIGASGIPRAMATIVGGAVGGGSSILSDLIQGKAINWKKFAVSLGIGVLAGYLGGAGAKNQKAFQNSLGKNSGWNQAMANKGILEKGLLAMGLRGQNKQADTYIKCKII